ncbi:MAG TPA: hypothetical protein VFF30_10660 [Nitrososphaerales archaeon]|nr:hypothetical protein [Nitrososphaerales archaeon]
MLTLQLPPNEETRKSVETLLNRELSSGLIAPSIVLTEFIEFAGPRMGEEIVLAWINLLKSRGMRVAPLGEAICVNAGKLLLAKRTVPIA